MAAAFPYCNLAHWASPTTLTMDVASEGIGGIFLCPKAGNIRYVGIGIVSVSSPNAYNVTLQSITALTPNGSNLAATTWTPVVGWTWVDLGVGGYTVTELQQIAGCFQYPASGGSGSCVAWLRAAMSNGRSPYYVTHNGTSWSRSALTPCLALKYEDGQIIRGSMPISNYATVTWNSSTNPAERASVFVAPANCTLPAVQIYQSQSNPWNATLDVCLYASTSTTATATVSIDVSKFDPSNAAYLYAEFASPPSLSAGTTYRVSVKAKTGSNISVESMTFASSAERESVGIPLWSDTRNGSSWIGENTAKAESIIPILSNPTSSGGIIRVGMEGGL